MATRTVLGTCHHDCPDSCGWVVTVEDGRAVQLRGNPDHPYSQGELCPKVNRFLDRVYSPDRVLHPLRRIGAKGSRDFQQITWDEALDEIATRLRSVIDTHGPEAVLPFSDAGNQSELSMASLDHRFFGVMGASRLERAICGPTVGHGMAVTNGSRHGFDPLDIRHSRLIVLWGTNTRITNRHLWPFIEDARRDGAQVVVIDPIRTATAAAADWFVQPFPGTDVALMLAMMHVLVRDDLIDHSYVDQHALGYDKLVERVAEWPPERAAAVCGLSIDEVERLAAAYGTIRPAGIRVLIGPEHHENGGMFFRTLACLPVLTGAWRDRGGGISRSTSVWTSTAVDAAHLQRPDLQAGQPRTLNMSRLGEILTDDALNPRVHALIVWNCNPLVIVPNAELTRAGLARDDLFTVVHEQFLTDSAAYADIVLPATTQIENLDVVAPWGHLYLGWNEAAIAPLGESVSNTELFRRLATAMGYTEPALFDDDETLLRDALTGIDVKELRTAGMLRAPLPEDLRPFADGNFATASGRAELWSDAIAARGHDPLPAYVAPREHPQGDAALAARFPLVMITTKNHTRFLNSSYSHLPKHGPLEGSPTLDLSEHDAAQRGIVDGDEVSVWNDRGELHLTARFSQRVRPGVVSVPFGWWMHQHPDGRVANSLTNDTLTDWGGGVAFHDTLVEVALRRHGEIGGS